MITKKMIKQAQKEVECVLNFAHHDFEEARYFSVDFDGHPLLRVISVCHWCGAMRVHRPDEIPE
jgi:hypothetical protein